MQLYRNFKSVFFAAIKLCVASQRGFVVVVVVVVVAAAAAAAAVPVPVAVVDFIMTQSGNFWMYPCMCSYTRK
jgi:hypothetical protein